MRLQKKLLHKILRYAEENATGQRLATPEFEDYKKHEVNYHIGLCYEAGFLHVHMDASPESDVAVYQIRKGITYLTQQIGGIPIMLDNHSGM